jgi:hypothetical protein
MERTERLKRLHAMLKQVAPKNAVEELPRPAVAESGLESLTPDSGVESGIRKLAENRLNDLTDHEQFALKAIVLPKTRPVVFVRGNSYDDIPAPWDSP